jgi:capsid protein
MRRHRTRNRGDRAQNLDKKLNLEQDMDRTAGMVETVWEKAAVGKKTETEKKKTTVQTEKRTVEKRTVICHRHPLHT